MNQKNKKGFTLIELLAVIVILAIIALIAVPVIMNIISKANESAFKDSAYGVISAGELYFAEQLLEPTGMTSNVTMDLSDTRLQIKGDVPEGQILITTEGKVAIAVHNNRYCVTKGIDDKDITVTEDIANCNLPTGSNQTSSTLSDIATTSPEVATISECVAKGNICPVGTLLAIQVNETDVYNFFVMEDDGTEATLLMDRNLGDDVYWDDDSENTSRGPVTALNQLNSYTAGWTKIAPMASYSYTNTNEYGYKGLQITNGVGTLTNKDGSNKIQVSGTSRARMITFAEVNNEDFWFLRENFAAPPTPSSSDSETDKPIVLPLASTTMQYSPNGYTNRGDYWTLTTDGSSSIRCVFNWGVGGTGQSMRGLRPVITLKK